MVARAGDMTGLPDWPRLLSREQAAKYLGMSPGTLRTHVPVRPKKVGTRVLYDRQALDRYVDGAEDVEDDWTERF